MSAARRADRLAAGRGPLNPPSGATDASPRGVKKLRKPPARYYVYMVVCADGTYYTGSTNDLAHRLQAHNAGTGAKYLRGRRPVRLVYRRLCQDARHAWRAEWALKQRTHAQKDALVRAARGSRRRRLVQDASVLAHRVGLVTVAGITGLLWFGGGRVAAEEMITIVALGDSTTAGTPGFRSPIEAPPNGAGNPKSQYAYWMMQRHPEWRVLNRGIAGERADQILQRFAQDVTATHPRLVIILAGVNDIYQGDAAPRIIARLQQLYEQAIQQHMAVVACTILPYAGIDAARRRCLSDVNAWIREYSASHGLLFCDLYRAVTDPQSPWQLKGSPDGLHPDVAGYRAMGDALTDVLQASAASLDTRQ